MTATRDERKAGLWIGGGLAVLLMLWAALQIATWTVGTSHHDEHHVLDGAVSAVRIQVDSGDLTLMPASDGRVTVDSRAQGSLWLPDVDVRLDGGDVRVRGDCPPLDIGRCSMSFVVHVPAGVPVTAHTSSGDVRASGLSAPVELSSDSGDVRADELSGGARLSTSSGDVTARGLAGTVRMDTSSGDVDAADLLATDVASDVSSGDIELEFAVAPQRVNAESSSGDVEILIPRGPESYRDEVDTSSGERDFHIRADPDSDRLMHATTSSGDVTVAYGGR